jgi:hypothetical protein
MAFYRRRTNDAPCEGHPHIGAVERERTDWGVVRILGVFALFIAFALWFYFKDKELASSDGTVQTIGSGPVVIPDSNENKPSPPREPATRVNPAAQPPAAQ